MKSELLARSPIRILEKTIHGGLGKGNLGVFAARKGVGKTACLVHVAVDKILRDQRVLHLSFADNPKHIEMWYEQVFKEVSKAYRLDNEMEDHEQITRNRLILHFNQSDATFAEIIQTIDQFIASMTFAPEVVIVDGWSFYDHTPDDLQKWKLFAEDHDTAVWFSATLHREAMEFDKSGIPAPVNRFSALLSVIIMLDPCQDVICLKLLKDHDSEDLEALKLKLDSKTMLIANHRV